MSEPELVGAPAESQAIQTKANDSYFSMEKFTYMQQMAQTLVKSGSLPSCYKNGSQVVAGMQYGWELGMKPMEAVRSIAIVNGRFSLHSEEAIARIKRAGWEPEYDEDEKGCKMTIRKGDKEYVETYTIEDAKVAGLLHKENWKKYPKMMMRYRAAANHRKFNIPEVMGGGFITVDEAEELEAPRATVSESPADDGFTKAEKMEEVKAEDVKIEAKVEIKDKEKDKPKKKKTKEEEHVASLFKNPKTEIKTKVEIVDEVKKGKKDVKEAFEENHEKMQEKSDLMIKITDAAKAFGIKGDDFALFVSGATGEKWEDANKWKVKTFETLLSALNKSIDLKNSRE